MSTEAEPLPPLLPEAAADASAVVVTSVTAGDNNNDSDDDTVPAVVASDSHTTTAAAATTTAGTSTSTTTAEAAAQPPPAAIATAPLPNKATTAAANNYNTASNTQANRPTQQRMSELEELRQKGLAKLLNKHFTGVIKTISKEKAEADAQLRDLEQRKAATSEFEASRQGQLSPFDALYVQLKKKRNECRRKERETLLLYQRYVHKFGSTGAVQVPSTAAPPPLAPVPPPDAVPRSAIHSSLVPSMAQAIDAKVSELKQMGADPIPTRDSLGMDTTYQALHARDSWELQQFFRRQLEERGIDARCCTVSPTMNPRKLFHGPRFPYSTAMLPQLLESPGSPDSKPIAMPWEYPFPGQLSSAPLYDNSHHHSTSQGASAGVVPGGMNHHYLMNEYHNSINNLNSSNHNNNNNMESVAEGFAGYVVNDYDDYDDRSMVSGLTSVNSAATMLMHETENRLVQFLKTETEAIRQMLSEEDEKSLKSGTAVGTATTTTPGVSPGSHAAAHAQQQHQHDDQMSTTQLSTKSNSEMGSHSSRAADQAEHMVKQMQEILNQFQKEAAARGEPVLVDTTTGTPNTTSTTAASTAIADPHEPRRVESANPDEEWVAYFDDTFQREYYHEVNSNRTQWELPEPPPPLTTTTTTTSGTTEASDCTSTSATTPSLTDYGHQQSSLHKTALLLSHEDVMPDRHPLLPRNSNNISKNNHKDASATTHAALLMNRRPSTRRELYLKKRRRQRNRRLIAALVAMSATIGLTIVWKQYQYPHASWWPDVAKQVVGEQVVTHVNQVTVQVLELEAVQHYYNVTHAVVQKAQNITVRVVHQVTNEWDKVQHHVQEYVETIMAKMAKDNKETATAAKHSKNMVEQDKSRSLLLEEEKEGGGKGEAADASRDLDSVDDQDANVPTSEGKEHGGSSSNNIHQKEVDDDESLVVTTVEDETDELTDEDKALEIAPLEEDMAMEVVVKIQRPWLCNIPFAWLLHPYCWRLAHEAPLFCAHTLANSMMQ